ILVAGAILAAAFGRFLTAAVAALARGISAAGTRTAAAGALTILVTARLVGVCSPGLSSAGFVLRRGVRSRFDDERRCILGRGSGRTTRGATSRRLLLLLILILRRLLGLGGRLRGLLLGGGGLRLSGSARVAVDGVDQFALAKTTVTLDSQTGSHFLELRQPQRCEAACARGGILSGGFRHEGPSPSFGRAACAVCSRRRKHH